MGADPFLSIPQGTLAAKVFHKGTHSLSPAPNVGRKAYLSSYSKIFEGSYWSLPQFLRKSEAAAPCSQPGPATVPLDSSCPLGLLHKSWSWDLFCPEGREPGQGCVLVDPAPKEGTVSRKFQEPRTKGSSVLSETHKKLLIMV